MHPESSDIRITIFIEKTKDFYYFFLGNWE